MQKPRVSSPVATSNPSPAESIHCSNVELEGLELRRDADGQQLRGLGTETSKPGIFGAGGKASEGDGASERKEVLDARRSSGRRPYDKGVEGDRSLSAKRNGTGDQHVWHRSSGVLTKDGLGSGIGISNRAKHSWDRQPKVADESSSVSDWAKDVNLEKEDDAKEMKKNDRMKVRQRSYGESVRSRMPWEPTVLEAKSVCQRKSLSLSGPKKKRYADIYLALRIFAARATLLLLIIANVDEAGAMFLQECFMEGDPLARGNLLYAALRFYRPEVKNHTPRISRSLKG